MIEMTSTGIANEKYSKALGIYKLNDIVNNRPRYKNGNGWHLYWMEDKRAWMVTIIIVFDS